MAEYKYVCFDGPDGGGKSTLVRNVYDELGHRDIPAFPRNFPSHGHVGTALRQALLGEIDMPPSAFLYLFLCDGIVNDADLRWLLKCGHLLIDRHPTLPSRVYQLQYHSAQHIEKTLSVTELLEPDVWFIVDVPAHVSRDRLLAREERDVWFESESIDWLETVRFRYLALADRLGAHILDGTKSVEELVDDVIRIAELG